MLIIKLFLDSSNDFLIRVRLTNEKILNQERMGDKVVEFVGF